MDKIYAGHGKIVNTSYGQMTKLSLHKDDVNKIVKYMKDNDSDWINLDVKEKKTKVEGKPTHYLEVDQWKPDVVNSATTDNNSVVNNEPPPGDDDLPF